MKRTLSGLMSLVVIATACGAPAPTPIVPVATTAASPVPPTAAPTAAPINPSAATAQPPVVSATQTPGAPTDPTGLSAALSADLSTRIPIALTPDASGQRLPFYEGYTVFPVDTPDGGVLYVAHTYGLRNFYEGDPHTIALYTRAGDEWQRLLNLKLEGPDYIPVDGVKRVAIEPGHLWLELLSGMGAHASRFELFGIEWNGRAVADTVSNTSDSPGAGEVRDVNGDGQLDVVLNQTDSYVFCYACGVRYFQFSVMRWDGQRLSDVELTPLPESAAGAKENNRAVQLAAGGLWKDAQAASAALIDSTNPAAQWNAVLIRLHAEAFQQQIGNAQYPLLEHVFYGDYAAAVDVMRPYAPEVLFSTTSPLIAGTVADGFVESLSQYAIRAATAALEAQPDLAEAYFVRAWGKHLGGVKREVLRPDLEMAQRLRPDDKFFSDSLAFFE